MSFSLHVLLTPNQWRWKRRLSIAHDTQPVLFFSSYVSTLSHQVKCYARKEINCSTNTIKSDEKKIFHEQVTLVDGHRCRLKIYQPFLERKQKSTKIDLNGFIRCQWLWASATGTRQTRVVQTSANVRAKQIKPSAKRCESNKHHCIFFDSRDEYATRVGAVTSKPTSLEVIGGDLVANQRRRSDDSESPLSAKRRSLTTDIQARERPEARSTGRPNRSTREPPRCLFLRRPSVIKTRTEATAIFTCSALSFPVRRYWFGCKTKAISQLAYPFPVAAAAAIERS